MLDPSGDVVGAAVGLGVLKVEILGCGGTVKGVEAGIPVSLNATGQCLRAKGMGEGVGRRRMIGEDSRMHASDLSSKGVHTASCLA